MCQPSTYQHPAETASSAVRSATGVDPADSDFGLSDLVISHKAESYSISQEPSSQLQSQSVARTPLPLSIIGNLPLYRPRSSRLSKQDKKHRAVESPTPAVGCDTNGRSARSKSQLMLLQHGQRGASPLVKLFSSRTQDFASFRLGCWPKPAEEYDRRVTISSLAICERRPGSSAAQSKGQAKQNASAKAAKSTGGRPGSKPQRKRALSSSDVDDSEPEDCASPKLSRNHRELDKVYFGCPFAKRFPDEYENEHGPCTRPKSITWRYMHEHLQRKHSARKKCPVCKKALEWPREQNWYDAWVQHYRIERRHTPEELARFPHIMTFDQEQVYMNPSLGKGPPEELWKEQYQRLFPEAQQVPSPYYDYYKRNPDRMPDEHYERGAGNEAELDVQSTTGVTGPSDLTPIAPVLGSPDSEVIYQSNFTSSDPNLTPSTQETSLSPIYPYTRNQPQPMAPSDHSSPVVQPASYAPLVGQMSQAPTGPWADHRPLSNAGEFGLHQQPIQSDVETNMALGVSSQPDPEPWHLLNTVDPKNTYSGPH